MLLSTVTDRSAETAAGPRPRSGREDSDVTRSVERSAPRSARPRPHRDRASVCGTCAHRLPCCDRSKARGQSMPRLKFAFQEPTLRLTRRLERVELSTTSGGYSQYKGLIHSGQNLKMGVGEDRYTDRVRFLSFRVFLSKASAGDAITSTMGKARKTEETIQRGGQLISSISKLWCGFGERRSSAQLGLVDSNAVPSRWPQSAISFDSKQPSYCGTSSLLG